MTIEGQKIFITGGMGFIGKSICHAFADRNKIILFDNNHRGSASNSLETHKNITLIKGDILDKTSLSRHMDGCTYVFHLASIAGIDTVVKMPIKVMEVGIIGLFNLLEVIKSKTELKQFINFSTSEIFGNFCFKPEEGEVAQLGPVGEARWTYAVSKLTGEHIVNNYWKEHGIPTTSIRPFNIYGPGQIGEGAVHQFVIRALDNKPLIVRNDGSQIRSWCYIDDIVNAMKLIVENENATGQIFNIGNPRSTLTIYHLAKKIISLSGSASEVVFEQWNGADIDLRIPNIDKAKRILGYEPVVELDEGLQQTIEWYKYKLI